MTLYITKWFYNYQLLFKGTTHPWFNSLSSDSAESNSIMSSSSSVASSKHNSQVSPVGHFTPPPAPIADNPLPTNDKAMSDSSSSSSLSICSTDSSTTTRNKAAKNRPNQDTEVDRVSMLLDELKSVVPRVEDGPHLSQPTEWISAKPATKMGPSTAPKNFNSQILKAINQKNQIVDSRDSLLDSIKSFSFNSLRRMSKPV